MTPKTTEDTRSFHDQASSERFVPGSAGLFFIIGAMKAGTTSLFEHLATHPELFPSSTKEPRYFLLDSPTTEDQEKYQALFADCSSEKWAFEASTGYTKHPFQSGVPGRIAASVANPRFIYMLRDPIERIYSHYLHLFATGQETRTFREAVEQDPTYVDTSRYFMQLSEYLKVFPAEQIHLVLMEEFSQDTETRLREVFEFLGVDRDFRPPNTQQVYHQTSQRTMLGLGLQGVYYRMRVLRKRLVSRPVLSGVVNCVTRPTRLLRKPVPGKSSIRDTVVEKLLRKQLCDDVEQIEEYLGRRIECWKTVHGSSQ
jgi:hypothetical protein